eukprot:Rhum_TRINITY_DN23194_c0_g1::Rhum_TRINITY_DN23194_c0_g1_i1::g.177359::m.177359
MLAVAAEGAVPHPAQVADKRLVRRPRLVSVGGQVCVPETDGVVGAARCEQGGVGAERALENVLVMRTEHVYQTQAALLALAAARRIGSLAALRRRHCLPRRLRTVGRGTRTRGPSCAASASAAVLRLRRRVDKLEHEDVARVVAGADGTAGLGRHRDAADGDVAARHKLLHARVRERQRVPQREAPALVADEQQGLVGVQRQAVHSALHHVLAPPRHRAHVPHLDGAVLAAADKVATVAEVLDGGHVAAVRLDGGRGHLAACAELVQADVLVARCGEEGLVGARAHAVDLAVLEVQGADADAAGCLPEADGAVVGRGGEQDGGQHCAERGGGGERGCSRVRACVVCVFLKHPGRHFFCWLHQ